MERRKAESAWWYSSASSSWWPWCPALDWASLHRTRRRSCCPRRRSPTAGGRAWRAERSGAGGRDAGDGAERHPGYPLPPGPLHSRGHDRGLLGRGRERNHPMRTCGWTAAGPRRRQPCQAGRYVTPSWATGSSGCGMEATARPFPVRRTGTRRIWRASASPPMRTYWSWSRMPLPPPDMRRRAAWPAFMWRQARTRWAMWRSTGSP